MNRNAFLAGGEGFIGIFGRKYDNFFRPRQNVAAPNLAPVPLGLRGLRSQAVIVNHSGFAPGSPWP